MAIVGAADCLEGIITDGDLRRALVAEADLGNITVNEVATSTPLIIGPMFCWQMPRQKCSKPVCNVWWLLILQVLLSV